MNTNSSNSGTLKSQLPLMKVKNYGFVRSDFFVWMLFFALFWASRCAHDPLVVGRIAVAPSVAPRHSRLETEPSIAAISLINKF